MAADSKFDEEADDGDDVYYYPIRLLLGRNGWGTGVHPTTRLCLEWLLRDGGDEGVILGGETLLDYGCDPSILILAAFHGCFCGRN